MDSSNNDDNSGFDFDKPAIYQITIKGELDPSWSTRLGDMQIKVKKKPGKTPITMLIGSVADQSALSGILNSLNDLHFTVLNVEALKKIN